MAASDSILSSVDLHALFEYRDGDLFWRVPAGPRGLIKAGSKAGTMHPDGYKSVRIKNIMLKQHRVIFHMFHGFCPKVIDHIDGNPSNNRIENLREATFSQNSWNSRGQARKLDGIKGVYWHKNKKLWIASCAINKRLHHIGYFQDKKDAEKAVMEFREKHHGEFARHM